MIGEHFLTVLMSTPRQQQEHRVPLCFGKMGEAREEKWREWEGKFNFYLSS